MENRVFIETFTTNEEYNSSGLIQVPLNSYITYSIHKYCAPSEVSLDLVFVERNSNADSNSIILKENALNFCENGKVPWQVSSCVYPVVMYQDTIITGLCAVARHICKHRTVCDNSHEHEEGLLGFRKSCLQAPNEVSIWTKFCEIDIFRTVTEVLTAKQITEIPLNLVRFENHLKKPVRVHNVYKIARNLKKENLKTNSEEQKQMNKVVINDSNMKGSSRTGSKNRKWKSHKQKELEINCSVKIEDLEISHNFAEGPFFTLADLILLPSYHIIVQKFGEAFKTYLPFTQRWYMQVMEIPNIQNITNLISIENTLSLKDVIVPPIEDVSLYKCDPKRHNPKKRLFTREEDVENALNTLSEGMELDITDTEFKSSINWDDVPDEANPNAGHLPDERVVRKTQQLENLALAVLNIVKDGDLIVDFCSGSGHLGILLAHLLPKCTIILLENKEQSLLRARERVQKMGLKNVLFFQCNLDFFNGKFDIGVALHACGIASDLVLDKCLQANAKFVLCPCCYGSLHVTDRLVYPRSNTFSSVSIDKYMCIGHASDQTHEEHPLTARGQRCMAAIDSDRARLAEQFQYKVTLSKLKPPTCTPKNNLLIGVPS